MSRVELHCDCVIIGAGVAGLWLRALLHAHGYRVVTIEKTAAGDGQTIASQGILHRGLKYRVSPEGSRAAAQLHDAESAWNSALEGVGPVPLRDVRVIANQMHMWAPSGGLSGMLAKATASMASLVMTSDARRLDANERPASFHQAPPDTAIFEVEERCVHVPSLLASLLKACDSPLLKDEPRSIVQTTDRVQIELKGGGTVTCQSVFACAGAGNESLIRMIGADPADFMQRRPLAMVAASPAPFDLNGHCIKPMSDKPRVTITTSVHEHLRYWWLGGSLAEDGVSRSNADQISAARDVIRQCVPWANPSAMRFSVHRIDRAEGRTPGGSRPDGPVVHSCGAVHFVWPTKLALAPISSSMCLAKVTTGNVSCRQTSNIEIEVAVEPWLKGGVQWK